MKRAYDFLRQVGTFYIATEENGQPRVRPFGAVSYYNERLYICTNNQKECFRQMKQNPKVEITAEQDGKWIRVSGEVVADADPEAKKAMMEENPVLKTMYSLQDGIFEVLYFKTIEATLYSFVDQPEIL